MAFQNGSGCARIDCPESKQAFGTRAKQFTADLAFDETVTVRVRDVDRYGRQVADIILPDGRWALFVGLQEPGIEPLRFLPKPKSEAKVSADLVRLFEDIDRESNVAMEKALTREDD